jgi:glutamine amidotransferase
MIGIVDYEAGNIASVSNALSAIKADFVVSNDAKVLSSCAGIILPGVGAAPGAMASLEAIGITGFLKSAAMPVLGICLGMQLLYKESEEGSTQCLGIIPGKVSKLDARAAKVPHMGWNVVEQRSTIPLMEGIGSREYFYFAHSFYTEIDARTVASTEVGFPFASVVQMASFTGVQFHPEKSGKAGLRLLTNFVATCS